MISDREHQNCNMKVHFMHLLNEPEDDSIDQSMRILCCL